MQVPITPKNCFRPFLIPFVNLTWLRFELLSLELGVFNLFVFFFLRSQLVMTLVVDAAACPHFFFLPSQILPVFFFFVTS